MTDVFGQPWTGRRVTVVGLGRSGLAAARLLCRVGARVRVTEARHTPGLQAAEQSLRAGKISLEQSRAILRAFEEGLAGYTYLERGD